MAKTCKVLDLCESGTHLVCIKQYGEPHQFHLYRIDWKHRTQLIKCRDFMNIIDFIRTYYMFGWDAVPAAVAQHHAKKWAEEYLSVREPRT